MAKTRHKLPKGLSAESLRQECDPASLGFATTDELPAFEQLSANLSGLVHADCDRRRFDFIEQELASGVIGIQDAKPTRLQVIEQATFGSTIVLHAAMEIQMLATEVRHDDRVELHARQVFGGEGFTRNLYDSVTTTSGHHT